ncbi:RHS repeat domain-containing protein, partial [Pseudomonas aeruginosa]|uniref:RHS repeat domain-containing protein n=1 Tax=Pseudomonas aeruginosa TaxID=287 RepID=UPI00398C63E2
TRAAASRLNSAENVRRCLLIRHLSHGEDFRLNRCPGSVDHYNSTFTYDDQGLLTSKRDNNGNLTTYQYNARGLETSRTEAAGTAQARTITTDWHPTLFLPVQVSEPGRSTRYQYDAEGRRTSEGIMANQ